MHLITDVPKDHLNCACKHYPLRQCLRSVTFLMSSLSSVVVLEQSPVDSSQFLLQHRYGLVCQLLKQVCPKMLPDSGVIVCYNR